MKYSNISLFYTYIIYLWDIISPGAVNTRSTWLLLPIMYRVSALCTLLMFQIQAANNTVSRCSYFHYNLALHIITISRFESTMRTELYTFYWNSKCNHEVTSISYADIIIIIIILNLKVAASPSAHTVLSIATLLQLISLPTHTFSVEYARNNGQQSKRIFICTQVSDNESEREREKTKRKKEHRWSEYHYN